MLSDFSQVSKDSINQPFHELFEQETSLTASRPQTSVTAPPLSVDIGHIGRHLRPLARSLRQGLLPSLSSWHTYQSLISLEGTHKQFPSSNSRQELPPKLVDNLFLCHTSRLPTILIGRRARVGLNSEPRVGHGLTEDRRRYFPARWRIASVLVEIASPEGESQPQI